MTLGGATGAGAEGKMDIGPKWRTDYFAARKQCTTANKPVAVVYGSGKAGWNQLGQGKLTPQVNEILQTKFIPVYVDTKTPDGATLAKNFGINKGVGIVVSDGKGKLQAFWHNGRLSNQQIAYYLKKHSNPTRNVTRTEQVTISNSRTSYYTPTTTPQQTRLYVPPIYNPVPAFRPVPAFGGGFGGGFGGFGGGFGGGCST